MFSRKKKQRFEHYLDRLYGYALAMSCDREMASEIVQDCVLRVLKARKTPHDEAAYRSWLFTIIRNLWLDHLRSSKRTQHVTSYVEPMEIIPEGISLESFESSVVNVLAVRQAFEGLSNEHRDILALVDISGFSYQETAKMLNIPRGTVMSRISRGRAALAEQLSDNNIVEMQSKRRQKKL